MSDYQIEKDGTIARWFAGGRAVLCHYCGVTLSPATVTIDHKVPRGRNRRASQPDNFLPACRKCNGEKGAGDYALFKAWKLPEKAARLAGLPVPDIGPSPLHPQKAARFAGLKMLPGRARVLRLLAADAAYALPAGIIPHRFLDGRMARLDGVTAAAFESRGWLERARPPAECKGYVFVWRITPAGRAALELLNARESACPSR